MVRHRWPSGSSTRWSVRQLLWGLLSDQRLTVDGTLIEAAASLTSFHGQRRSNATHQSTTDPEALLAKKGKGKEAHLPFMGQALMENRNGLVVDFRLTQASGTAERDIAPQSIDDARECVTQT